MAALPTSADPRCAKFPAICSRRSSGSARLYQKRKNYHETGARPTGPLFRSRRSLGRRELALGGGALLLGHGREALALAGILALAGVRRALARALALAGVGAHALAFVGGIGGGGRQRGAGQEQGGGGGGKNGTGLGRHLHRGSPQSGNDGAVPARGCTCDSYE